MRVVMVALVACVFLAVPSLVVAASCVLSSKCSEVEGHNRNGRTKARLRLVQ